MKSTARNIRAAPPRPARLFDGFRRDHARVLARLAATERAVFATSRQGALAPGAAPRLASLVTMLQRQFATHMTAEDALLYPLLVDVLPESRVTLAPLAEDHAELRCLLASLADSLRARPGAERDEQAAVQLRDLVDLLRLHIHREETAVFEMAERILDPRAARALQQRLAEFVSVVSPNLERTSRPKRGPRRASERRKS